MTDRQLRRWLKPGHWRFHFCRVPRWQFKGWLPHFSWLADDVSRRLYLDIGWYRVVIARMDNYYRGPMGQPR
jgi:hypothetical protein